jgi:hypothetical protein
VSNLLAYASVPFFGQFGQSCRGIVDGAGNEERYVVRCGFVGPGSERLQGLLLAQGLGHPSEEFGVRLLVEVCQVAVSRVRARLTKRERKRDELLGHSPLGFAAVGAVEGNEVSQA